VQKPPSPDTRGNGGFSREEDDLRLTVASVAPVSTGRGTSCDTLATLARVSCGRPRDGRAEVGPVSVQSRTRL
jgi:hypothetical protein